MSKKISELTAASTLTGTELVEVVQSSTNKKTTTQDIADLANNGLSELIEVQVTITAAQITNSFTSPITLATAPDGYIPIIIGPVFANKTYVGAVFATNTNCRVSVGGQTSASLSDTMTAGGDAHQLVDVTTGSNLNAYGGADVIVFKTLIGNPTGGGTSTVTIYFTYRLIPA